MTRSIWRLTAAAIVILATYERPLIAQSGSIWLQTFSSRIRAFDFTPLGTLLIQFKSALIAIEPATGKQLWSRSDGVDSETELIPGLPIVFTTTASGGAVLDLHSGNERWTASTLGLSAIKAIVPVPVRNVVLVYGETRDSPYSFVAAEYETGKAVWKTTIPYAGKRSKRADVQTVGFVVDTDHTIVLDPADDGLMRLDLRTGAILWRIAERDLDSGSARLNLVAGDRMLFAAYDTKVLAVSLEDGKIVWTRKENFPVPVAEMMPNAEGLLVRGSYATDSNNRRHWRPYLALLDSATGATKWTTEKTDFSGRSEMRVENNTIVIGLKEGLGRYDLATGRAVQTLRPPAFAGREDPCCLQRFEDGRLLIWSSQNLLMLDRSDQPLYSVYLKAPGRGLLDKMMTTAGLVVGEAMYQQMFPYHVSDAGPRLLNVFTDRFRATHSGERFVYIVTEETGFGGARFALVRVDKETGKEAGRVWFIDRAPAFKIDPTTGIVVVENGSTLYALRFESTVSR